MACTCSDLFYKGGNENCVRASRSYRDRVRKGEDAGFDIDQITFSLSVCTFDTTDDG